MEKSTSYKLLLIVGLALVLDALLAPIGAYSHFWRGIIGFCAYATFVYLFCKKFNRTIKPSAVMLASMCGSMIMLIPKFIISLEAIYSLDNSIIYLLGCFVGWLLVKYPRAWVVILMASITLLVAYYLYLAPMWRSYFSTCGAM